MKLNHTKFIHERFQRHPSFWLIVRFLIPRRNTLEDTFVSNTISENTENNEFNGLMEFNGQNYFQFAIRFIFDYFYAEKNLLVSNPALKISYDVRHLEYQGLIYIIYKSSSFLNWMRGKHWKYSTINATTK